MLSKTPKTCRVLWILVRKTSKAQGETHPGAIFTKQNSIAGVQERERSFGETDLWDVTREDWEGDPECPIRKVVP